MRKVLAKNPQVEQQKLHRRIFLEDVNPENQSLVVRLLCLFLLFHQIFQQVFDFVVLTSDFSFLQILISCFVKTSHREEYLSVKVSQKFLHCSLFSWIAQVFTLLAKTGSYTVGPS